MCKKKEGGGFTNEYRMYNRERARPLFCGMLTMDAKGHFGPSFFQLLENTETSGVACRMGTRGTVICLCLAWKSGPPVYSLSRVFLEDGLFWTTGELCALFPVIFFCVKILKAEAFFKAECEKQTFSPLSGILSNPFHPSPETEIL